MTFGAREAGRKRSRNDLNKTDNTLVMTACPPDQAILCSGGPHKKVSTEESETRKGLSSDPAQGPSEVPAHRLGKPQGSYAQES